MKYWRLIPHHDDRDSAVNETRRLNRISIGWGNIGTLQNPLFTSPQKISEAIKSAYPELKNAPDGGRVLWLYLHEMKEGDLCWIRGTKREAVGRIISPYFYDVDNLRIEGYAHHRSIEILHTGSRFPDHIRPIPGQNPHSTLLEYEDTK